MTILTGKDFTDILTQWGTHPNGLFNSTFILDNGTEVMIDYRGNWEYGWLGSYFWFQVWIQSSGVSGASVHYLIHALPDCGYRVVNYTQSDESYSFKKSQVAIRMAECMVIDLMGASFSP